MASKVLSGIPWLKTRILGPLSSRYFYCASLRWQMPFLMFAQHTFPRPRRTCLQQGGITSIGSMKMPCSQSERIKRKRDLSLKLAWRANLFSFLRCYAPVWHFHYNNTGPPCKFVLRGRIKRKCARTSKKCFICQ